MLGRVDIERAIGCSSAELEAVARDDYTTHSVPKPAGGSRLVHAPSERLMVVQRALLSYLTSLLPVHEAATAQLGPLKNARRHAGAKTLLCFDVVDFFDNLSSAKLRQCFTTVFDFEAAALLTQLTTRCGCLVQGAPTSTFLADFACYKLDERLSQLCAGVYTRFVDDITFSAQRAHCLPTEEHVVQALADSGLAINAAKTRRVDRTGAMLVTGLLINEQPGRPSVRAPRNLWRRLRAGMHLLEKRGCDDAVLVEEMQGLSSYLAMTDPARAAPYRRQLRGMRKATMRSIYRRGGQWYWVDEVGSEHGPCASRESAVRRQNLYVTYCLDGSVLSADTVVLKPDARWQAERDREPPDVHGLHPCDNAAPWECECSGACSCHWEEKKARTQ